MKDNELHYGPLYEAPPVLEEDAIDLAGEVKSGSMVLPESSEPVFYFIMRVD